MSDFGGQVIGSTGSSGQVMGIGSRTHLSDNENTTIERKLEEQIDKPLAELDEEEQNETDKLFETSAIGSKDISDIPELVNMFQSKKKGGKINVNRKTKKNRKKTKHYKKLSHYNKNNIKFLSISHIKKKKLKENSNNKKTKKLKNINKKNKSMKKINIKN